MQNSDVWICVIATILCLLRWSLGASNYFVRKSSLFFSNNCAKPWLFLEIMTVYCMGLRLWYSPVILLFLILCYVCIQFYFKKHLSRDQCFSQNGFCLNSTTFQERVFSVKYCSRNGWWIYLIGDLFLGQLLWKNDYFCARDL